MSLLFRSGFGWSRNRSPRNSASDRPRFWSMTPIEPSKITIRCLNSRSRRSWTESATAMTVKSTKAPGGADFSASDGAPDLEAAVVVEQVPAAGVELLEGGLALDRIDGSADVR